MSFAIVLPADDSRPTELREMGSERSAHEQIRETIGDLVEIVRARGLHHLAPNSGRCLPWHGIISLAPVLSGHLQVKDL